MNCFFVSYLRHLLMNQAGCDWLPAHLCLTLFLWQISLPFFPHWFFTVLLESHALPSLFTQHADLHSQLETESADVPCSQYIYKPTGILSVNVYQRPKDYKALSFTKDWSKQADMPWLPTERKWSSVIYSTQISHQSENSLLRGKKLLLTFIW